MTAVTADKIFIDADAEINFIVESILESERQRVILVVPNGSVIATSSISVRIIAKQLLKSDKLLVLTTEDDELRRAAKRSGLVVVAKVSDVTAAIWEKVALAKSREVALLEKHEQQLLAERRENVEPGPESVSDKELQLDNVADTADEQEDLEEGLDSVADDEQDETIDNIQADDKAVDKPDPAKNRIPSKVVEVEGLKLMVGGDIAAKRNEPVREEVSVGDDVEPKQKPEKSFVGTDWTGRTSATEKDPQARKQALKKRDGDNLEHTKSGGGGRFKFINSKNRNKFLVGLVVIVILIAGFLYVLMSNAFVTIDIERVRSNVEVEEQVNAAVSYNALNIDELQLPAEVIQLDEPVSRSATGDATGTGETGDKASGIVDFYNKTDKQISIKSGTKITGVVSGLNYIIKEDFNIDAASDGASPGLARDVRVEAESFGEKYNITDDTGNTQFRVEGYETSAVSAIRIRDIEGGTTRQIETVSQQNYDQLYNDVKEKVKSAALSELENSVPGGYVLLPGTEKYEESDASSTPAVGDEGTEFDVSVSGTATALAVSEDDLQALLTALIAQNSGGEVGDVQAEAGVPQVMEASRDGDSAVFTITSEGMVQTRLNEESIHQLLAGKSVDAADSELAGVDGIDSYEIIYSPGLVPGFLRTIPSEIEKVRVRID